MIHLADVLITHIVICEFIKDIDSFALLELIWHTWSDVHYCLNTSSCLAWGLCFNSTVWHFYLVFSYYYMIQCANGLIQGYDSFSLLGLIQLSDSFTSNVLISDFDTFVLYGLVNSDDTLSFIVLIESCDTLFLIVLIRLHDSLRAFVLVVSIDSICIFVFLMRADHSFICVYWSVCHINPVCVNPLNWLNRLG